MRKRKHKKTIAKLGLIFTIFIIILASISMSYAAWTDTITINGTVTTGEWGSCLCIRKILNGPFTNPYDGTELPLDGQSYYYEMIDGEEVRLVHQTDRNSPTYEYDFAPGVMYKGFPTQYILTIEIKNDCNTDFTDLVVTDQIGNQMAPREVGPVPRAIIDMYPGDRFDVTFSRGFYNTSFGHDDIIWTIDLLEAGETAYIKLLVESLPNRAHGKGLGGIKGFFEPTDYDQYIEVNQGATISYESQGSTFIATTDEIVIDVDPFGDDDDWLGKIVPADPIEGFPEVVMPPDSVVENVLYYTEWTCAESDFYCPDC